MQGPGGGSGLGLESHHLSHSVTSLPPINPLNPTAAGGPSSFWEKNKTFAEKYC